MSKKYFFLILASLYGKNCEFQIGKVNYIRDQPFTLQLYSPHPAPVCSSGRLAALGENDCDWWKENNEPDSSDVIGGKSECTL